MNQWYLYHAACHWYLCPCQKPACWLVCLVVSDCTGEHRYDLVISFVLSSNSERRQGVSEERAETWYRNRQRLSRCTVQHTISRTRVVFTGLCITWNWLPSFAVLILQFLPQLAARHKIKLFEHFKA